MLHGAGYGKSARFDKKRLEHVRRTIDAKVGGAAALMALTRQDPLRWFVAFGSIAGRFGGNGLTDYAAANDMLAKLIDWFRSERPQCASACFHWDSWAGVGMAMKPKSLVGAKSVLKLDFMPPEEGLAHLLAEIEAGLPECETLITNGQFQRTFYPSQTTRAPSEPCGSAAPDPGPRLEGGNLPQHPPPPCRRPSPVKEAGNRPTVTNRPLVDRWHDAEAGQGMVAEMRLDPIGDVFLREHRLRDRPLLPGVISMEAIVEAAALYDSGRTVAALEEVHFHRSMTFYTDAPVDARVEVLPAERGVRCTLASDFRARDGRLVERNRVFATGFVELAEKRPDIAAAPSGRPADWHPSQYREGRLIHHGPPFRCLAGYAHRKTAGWGRIAASSPADLAGTRPEAGWIIPAAALDACLVACGHYLSVEFRSALEIPHKFDRLCLGVCPAWARLVWSNCNSATATAVTAASTSPCLGTTMR